MSNPIKYYSRRNKKEEIEKVYGDSGVRFLYESKLGTLVRSLVIKPWFSQLYGYLQSHPLSSRKVTGFVQNFSIPMQDYLPGTAEASKIEQSYKHFNEFFIRQFRAGKRHFSKDPSIMPAFSEARYYGWESVNDDLSFPVKGVYLNASSLLGSLKEEWRDTFHDGPLLLARLCPVDYHRYHYPDSGQTIQMSDEGDELESVNPLALKVKPEIFLKNKRRVSVLETENFGKLAYIEVGATCVGKIIQSHQETDFKRGEEKGYFLFGGSTVIVIGEKGKWKPSADILEKTSLKQEVLVELGEEIAIANTLDDSSQ